LPSGTVVGGYQIIKKLAAGGFGVVYLAEDADRHLVALKEYLPSSLAERSPGELTPRVKPEKQPLYRLGLKSFFEEGRSLAQISHSSVVSVLNFFRENETVYMVMNYLQGDTLQDFIVTARDLKRDKVFRESTIRSLFDEILRGLRIVHQHKMLHLDIKPANIFITNDNKAVLLDFGAAREVLSRKATSSARCTHRASRRPRCTAATARSAPGPTSMRSARASTHACRAIRPTTRRSASRRTVSRLSLSRLRNVYSDNLIEVTEWCMSLDPLSRPQSVFALQKELARETERRYTKLSFSERLKLQLENLTSAKA
jgi:serine/threonine protein kinase